MRLREAAQSVSEATELPRIVALGDDVYGAAFELMKLLPARFMLDRAEQTGALEPETTVIETSSGTFGLGLAILCRLRGYQLIVVGDPAIDSALRHRLEELGARVSIVRGPVLAREGVQQARLARVRRFQERAERFYTPVQYDNPDNARAYAPVAELVLESLGRVDCLVGAVGSGGSTCGTASFLRTVLPDLTLVGVDTPGSVLFGLEPEPRMLRGLGSSLLPRNLDHTAFDDVHWVGAAEAFLTTRLLHRRHCLYMGATSGAAYLVARWWAHRNPGARVVALLPDAGFRYASTVYNENWLRANDVFLDEEPAAPRRVDDPSEVAGGWSRLAWGRRSLADVLKQAA